MPLTQEMRRLRAEHAALVTLSGFMIEFVAGRRPPRPTELAAVRGMFRDTLVRHLKCEDWALYPRLQTKGEPVLAELAARFVDAVSYTHLDVYKRQGRGCRFPPRRQCPRGLPDRDRRRAPARGGGQPRQGKWPHRHHRVDNGGKDLSLSLIHI